MQSITKEYLLDIIGRKISATIQQQRKQKPLLLNVASYSAATAAEIQEFVLSIPYFDTKLKNFLMSAGEEQTIISQAWELEFIKKCELWLQSYEWMYGKPNLSPIYKNSKESLSLPY